MVQGVNTSPSTPPAIADFAPTPLAPAGDPEGMIAEISLRLDDSQQRSRDAERRSRRLRTEARRESISDKRKGAVLRLVGTVVQSAAQATAATVSIGSAGAASNADEQGAKAITSRGEGLSDLINAGGSAAKAGFDFAASDRDSDAEGMALSATEHSEHADMLDQAAESAERFSDKAMGHMEAIARAKHEAMMAALRG